MALAHLLPNRLPRPSELFPWLLAGGTAAALGYASGQWGWAVAAALALGYLGSRFRTGRRSGRCQPGIPAVHVPSNQDAAEPDDEEQFIRQMLRQGRAAVLLHPQLRADLPPELVDEAVQAVRRRMVRLGPGVVVPGRSGNITLPLDEEQPPEEATIVWEQVDRFYLDGWVVTNEEYLAFVQDGGYEDPGLWNPEIASLVPDFVDSTGAPGPRFWKNGRFFPGEEELPVVGVCWYEALAYARWAGKTLPTAAQWELAAARPVAVGAATLCQRRYPWGDAFQRERANVWQPGQRRLLPARAIEPSPRGSGLYQLIGNVWEWTLDDFVPPDACGELPALKQIRGGAYDTYFDNQATAQFQSGQSPLDRKHNVGFRCAVAAALVEPKVGGPGQLVAASACAKEVSP